MNEQIRTPLLVAEGISKDFRIGHKETLHAVSDVSLTLYKGETVALVGESGCGKSTLARMMIGLLRPTAGTVRFEGMDITDMATRRSGPLRRRMQMVFQDPYASLDPRMTVRDIIAEPLSTWHICRTRKETTDRVMLLMDKVGLPEEFLYRYPHQFSGGQRQRIGIARAIALDPDLLVCDEPVSALDVSVQSQVLNLLKKLGAELHLTNLFIGHDLSVIHFIADRVCVMYLGQICEIACKDELYAHPAHPYTRFLLDSIPAADPHRRNEQKILIEGELPSPVDPPSGCRFRTRCPYARKECGLETPQLQDMGSGHLTACRRVYENRGLFAS